MVGQNIETKLIITAKADRAARVLKRLTGGLDRVRSRVFSLQSAFALLGGGLLVRELIQTASSFEDLRTQLDALQGSAQAGGESLEWIKDFAKETPLSMEGVTRAFVMARAFGLDPMDGTMQSLVDINAKLGGKMEKLIFITRGVGQMFTKGRISAQEMNLQLTEQGVPAWELLAKAMNRANNTTQFTTASLQKMSERGELGKDAIKLLIDEMGRFGEGAAFKKMDDFTGLWSNFGDQISQAKDEFAKADRGLFAFVKGGLAIGIKKLEAFRDSGALKEWGKGVGDTMLNAAEVVLIGTAAMSDALQPIFETARDGVNAIISVFNSLPDWMKPLGVVGAILLGPKLGAVAVFTLGLLNPIIQGVKDIKRSFEGYPQGTSPISELNLDLIELKDREGVLGDAARGIEALRLQMSQSGKTEIPDTGGSATETTAAPAFAIDFEKIKSDARLIALTQRNIRAEMAVVSEAERIAADHAFKQAEIENESSHLERLMELNGLVSQSGLDLKAETIARLAEMDSEAAAAELERIRANEQAKADAVIQGEALKRKAQQFGLSTAMTLAKAAAAFSTKNSKVIFLITRGLMAAQAFVATQAAAAQALAIPPSPNHALQEAARTAGMANVAAIIATSFSPGGGLVKGGGGGGGGTTGTAGGLTQNFSSQQNQTQQPQQGSVKLDITINTLDPSMVDWDEVVENMETALGDKIESNSGNFGNVQLQFDTRGG